jgi:hypothetical protein
VYLIVHHSGFRPYISGVFREKAAIIAYLAGFDIQHQAVIEEFTALTDTGYPLYLFEASGQPFTLHSAAGITAMLAALVQNPSDDWCYGNVYQLNHDWQPRRAGSDAMGLLPHIHIYNHDLNNIKSLGVAACFRQDNTEVE